MTRVAAPTAGRTAGARTEHYNVEAPPRPHKEQIVVGGPVPNSDRRSGLVPDVVVAAAARNLRLATWADSRLEAACARRKATNASLQLLQLALEALVLAFKPLPLARPVLALVREGLAVRFLAFRERLAPPLRILEALREESLFHSPLVHRVFHRPHVATKRGQPAEFLPRLLEKLVEAPSLLCRLFPELALRIPQQGFRLSAEAGLRGADSFRDCTFDAVEVPLFLADAFTFRLDKRMDLQQFVCCQTLGVEALASSQGWRGTA
mmetsp:Transcript_98332/g.278075  ORF Transcript_98332/g.278075 Transcript_98332/m.278075 type:complete len:265 (+) Transcript_98332:208-1002(+)